MACVCGQYLECYIIAVVIRTRAPRSAIVQCHAYAEAFERLAVKAGSQYDARPCVASRQSCVDAGHNALER